MHFNEQLFAVCFFSVLEYKRVCFGVRVAVKVHQTFHYIQSNNNDNEFYSKRCLLRPLKCVIVDTRAQLERDACCHGVSCIRAITRRLSNSVSYQWIIGLMSWYANSQSNLNAGLNGTDEMARIPPLWLSTSWMRCGGYIAITCDGSNNKQPSNWLHQPHDCFIIIEFFAFLMPFKRLLRIRAHQSQYCTWAESAPVHCDVRHIRRVFATSPPSHCVSNVSFPRSISWISLCLSLGLFMLSTQSVITFVCQNKSIHRELNVLPTVTLTVRNVGRNWLREIVIIFHWAAAWFANHSQFVHTIHFT